MLIPGAETLYTNRLDPRRRLAAIGSIRRDNPDETPLIEAVELVRRFQQESEESDYRTKAVRMWETCDRFLDGEQWDWLEDFGGSVELAPWQAKLTINKLHKMHEKWVSLLMENLPEWEYVSRDPANTIIADTLDMYVSHEWERNNWLSVFGMALKQMVSHSTSFLKVFWDVHGDGGRGSAAIEAVSNYDLFIDEGAMVRDGKLKCKFIIHRMEMTRNKILSIYDVDPGGEIRSGFLNDTKGRPLTRLEQYIDDLNTGKSSRGGGGTGGASMHTMHPGRGKRKDTYDVYECLYYDDTRVEGVELDDTAEEIPPLKYPNGRVITICDGKLLSDKANKLGFNPYVALSMSPSLERIYSPSVVWHCLSPQMELNKRRSQIADHASLAANPVLVVSQFSNVNQEDVVGEPGEVIVSMDTESPDGGVRWLIPPGLSKEVVESAISAEIDIDAISGIAEIDRGQKPNQLESGVALDIHQQSTMTVPSMHSAFVDQGFKEVLRCVGSLFLDFVPDKRKFKYMDTRQIQEEYGTFDPVNLLLPSRHDAVAAIKEKQETLRLQLEYGEMELSAEDYETLATYIFAQIDEYEDMIQQVWELPASDLISFDVSLQTGTRGMTQQAIATMARDYFDIGAITVQSLMEKTKFPNWMRDLRLKMDEVAAQMAAEEQMMEQQLEIEREIDEDEHEQELEKIHTEGKYRLAEAEIRARVQRENAMKAKKKENS